MKKFHFIIIFLISPFLFSYCDLQYIKTINGGNFFYFEKIALSGDKLFVHGGNYIKSYNVSDPENPIPGSTTEDLSHSCGDSDHCTQDMSLFENDKIIFLSAIASSKGVRGYDITKSGYPCVGYVEYSTPKAIGSFITNQGKRYVVWGGPSGLKYADFSDDQIGNCKELNYSTISEIKRQPNQIYTFKYSNKVYMALASLTDGFALYDVTSFPSYSLVFTTSDNAYDVAFYGGFLYLNCDANTNSYIKIYDMTGQFVAQISTHSYSYPRGINVDSNFIYTSLSECSASQGYYGFNIFDKNTQASILPPDFVPNSCGNEVDFDSMGIARNGNLYFLRSAFMRMEIYKIICGDYANITLNNFSPQNVDPGTTFPLNISLKNTGTVSAENVSATLSETNDKVTITGTNPQNYGTIAPNQSVQKSYTINVASDATAGPIYFTLQVSTTNAGSFTINFQVSINEPRPILTRTIAKNVSSQSLDVTYTNTGNADFTGSFTLSLTPYTKGVSFSPSSNTFSNIPKGSSQTKNYPYTLSGNCSPLNFISLYSKESPAKSDVPEEYLNVDLLSGTGSYPFIVRNSSSVSKNGTNCTLSLTLKNIGQATGNNISVTLSANSSDVSWATNNQNYGNIVQNSTKTMDFSFTVPDGFSQSVTFTAEITSNEGCWEESFNHYIGSIEFQYVDEKHCACGAHCTSDHPDISEPPEGSTGCEEFSFKLKNNGTANATNVPATLSLRQDYGGAAYVSQPYSSYSINAGQTGFNSPPFEITLTSDYCSGNSCPTLKLRIQIPDYNFTKDINFTVLPYQDNPPPPNCNLSYKNGSIQITSDSNSDGKANPGETIQFTIEIQNTGGTDAGSVKGTLSEDSSKADYITINTSTVNFGTIKAGQSVRNTTPFQFTLSSDAPTGGYYFPLIISSSCSSSNFSSTIPITVYSSGGGTVTLSYQSYYVSGSSDPTYLEAGKTQTLYVTLKNESTSPLTTSQATLSTTEPKVQITSQGTYTIMAGKTGTAPFTVVVDSSYKGSSIPFHIEVQNAVVTNPDFSVAVGSPPPPPPPPVQALSIPVIVHSPGANGTFWKTDVFLQNPSSENQTLTLKLLKAEEENQNPPQSIINFSPYSSLTIKDILDNSGFPEFRGYSLAGLLIEFSSPVPPFVSARIYNDQGSEGTYGQFVPGIPVSNKTRGTAGDIPAYLVGMVKNKKYRSNIGLANVSSSYNELKITLIDSDGFNFGSQITKVLAPYNVTQIQDIAGAAGLSGDIGAFTVKVESNTKVDFIAWGSVVDNITGDASFINDQVQSYNQSLIMGVAHAVGAIGTNWRTDLNIYNPSSSDLVLRLSYYRYGYDGFTVSKRLSPIPSGGTVIIEDVLSNFSGLNENEAGFIIAYPENSVSKNPVISARTYNDLGTSGTYGQFVSALDFENGGVLSGKKLYFSGISMNSNFRANLGILNADGENPNTITVSLYDNAGNLVSSFQEYMPYPNMGIQINYDSLAAKFEIPSFDGYSIVVSGSTNTFSYISQVDNRSSDPIFILPSLR